MQKEHAIIDFEIIWKKINDTITEEEEVLLTKWLNEHPSHQQYFDKACSFYLEGSTFSGADLAPDKIWEELNIRALKHRHVGLRRIISLSAAAVILALLSISYFVTTSKTQSEAVTISMAELIKPGSKQATLTLGDGSIHDLTTSQVLNLTEGSAKIKHEGAKLQYIGEKVAVKEIKYNTLRIPRGGEFFLELSDGTKVWLNSETVLRYPVQFTGKDRRVELLGEAYFEVAKNEKMPFVVESGEQSVHVLGTEFNISCYNDNPKIVTTLVHGRVEISIKSMPDNSQILSPNEQSSFNVLEGQITKRIVDPYWFIAWKSGRLVFRDQRLEDIMKMLAKWYNVEVVFAHEELRNYHFTGDLERYADFGEVLNKIGKMKEINFTIEKNQITIR